MIFTRLTLLLFCLFAIARAQATCPPVAQQLALRAAAEAVPGESVGAQKAWAEALDVARHCQKEAPSVAHAEYLFEVLLIAAQNAQRNARADQAYQWLLEGLALAKQAQLPRQQFKALNLAAQMDLRAARQDSAQRFLREVLSLTKAQHWDVERAEALSDLSNVERRRANYFDALSLERAALNLRRSLSPPSETWRSFGNLAVLYEQIELFDLARSNYLAALNAATENGVAKDIADARLSYADFLNDFGVNEASQALALAEQALPVLRGGDPVREAAALLQIGRARMQLGQMDGALSAFQEAYNLAARSNAKSMLAHVQFRWGEYEFLRANREAALGRIEQARTAYLELENRHRLIKVTELLERVYQSLGRDLDAARAGREHFRLRNEVLGVGATQKLSELLSDFELSEERTRNAELKAANDLSALKLATERRIRLLSVSLAGLLVLGFLALGYRHWQTQRLNHLLRAQQTKLSSANEALKAKSAELYHATITDSLTGLRNRRFAMTKLAEMLSAESKTEISLLLLDLDNFKKINDQFGHPIGDQVLIAATFALSKALPSDALLARIGGEEFLVVLANRTPEQSLRLADLARAAVCAEPVATDKGELPITLSIGVHCIPASIQQSLSQALRDADQALYLAKNSGRNTVKMLLQSSASFSGAEAV
jgi:diguanylate cyclase (GGDEF)-like protein